MRSVLIEGWHDFSRIANFLVYDTMLNGTIYTLLLKLKPFLPCPCTSNSTYCVSRIFTTFIYTSLRSERASRKRMLPDGGEDDYAVLALFPGCCQLSSAHINSQPANSLRQGMNEESLRVRLGGHEIHTVDLMSDACDAAQHSARYEPSARLQRWGSELEARASCVCMMSRAGGGEGGGGGDRKLRSLCS